MNFCGFLLNNSIAHNRNETRRNMQCIALIVGILLLRFCRTVFTGKSISKLYIISHWDSLFQSVKCGAELNLDPSLVQLHIPYRFFVAQYWHHAIPLWNEFNGFGAPLLADPQAFVFSPIFALFYFVPNLYTWNLTLIMELAISAFATFFLCRELELDCLAALVAAFLFTFCPYLQSQLELLGNGLCMVPVVFCLFVRAAKNKSMQAAALAGACAAAHVLSAHPEHSFMTILTAVVLFGLTDWFADKGAFTWSSLFKRLALIFVVTFGLAAPMAFCFIEYLLNGETIKLIIQTNPLISWQDLVANYLFPFSKEGSPYFGPLSWFGLAFALTRLRQVNRLVKPVIICLVISFMVVVRFFPFNWLFCFPPFSMIWAFYCLPEYFAFITVLSGWGISELLNVSDNYKKVGLGLLCVMTVALCSVPLIAALCRHNYFDISSFSENSLRIDLRTWLFNLVCAGAMLAAWLSTAYSKARPRRIGQFVFLAIGVLNLIIVSYRSLPLQEKFHYPEPFPIRAIAQENSRFLPLGNHLCRPNTNLIYDLPELPTYNPIFPKGYVAFMQACGARTDAFCQYFSATISRLLDVTNTGTILAEQPPLDENCIPDEKHRGGIDQKPTAVFAEVLSLWDLGLCLDKTQNTVFYRMRVKPLFPPAESFHFSAYIRDSEGHTLECERQIVNGLFGEQIITGSAFLPKQAKHWNLWLSLVRDRDSKTIAPCNIAKGSISKDGSWLFASSGEPNCGIAINNSRFTPVESLYGGAANVQIPGPVAYKNRSSLPRSFFVTHVVWATNWTAALHSVKERAADLGNLVILEQAQRSEFENYARKSGSEASSFYSPDTNSAKSNQLTNSQAHGEILSSSTTFGVSYLTTSSALELKVDCPQPAVLVTSDLYYPGWEAYLDGIKCPIFRADYLFRATLVPSGKHILRFEYRPLSFLLAAILFTISLLSVLLVCGFGSVLSWRHRVLPPK
jgi:hypothetical protein